MKFVILLGGVSLFADMTYEGARSINGPYLALFGTSAAVVGFVAGFGELIGYALRLLSGYISDKTGRYWAIMIGGYVINLLAVPFLALAGHWPMAVALMIAERAGKAIRNPARDAMLSHATHEMGHGWGFGLHEAMDQIGAMLGPLIVAAILYFRGSYRLGYAVLLIPALLAFAVLFAARLLYPRPHDLEINIPSFKTRKFSRVYWLYLLGVCLIAAGYADFPLIAYHFEKVSTVPKVWVPVFYSIAMGTDALAALICGWLFDRFGLAIVAGITMLSLFFAPFVFLGGFAAALIGMILWGVGMGSQESILRAVIASVVPPEKRGTAFGIFNAAYGLSWFLGSLALGFLYGISLPLLVLCSMGLQLAAVPLVLFCRRHLNKHASVEKLNLQDMSE